MEAKVYYLDDERAITEFGPIATKLFTSSGNFSSEKIELSGSVKKDIYRRAFNDVVNFYNQKEELFLNVEKDIGVNFWFLEHFRLYHTYRGFLIKIANIEDFLRKEKNGIVVSSDQNISLFIDEHRIRFVPAKKSINGRMYFRLIREFMYIFFRFRRIRKLNSRHLILSNISDIKNGKNKRFGALELQYETLLNRELFNVKNDLSSYNNNLRSKFKSDDIFFDYIRRFTFLSDLKKISKVLSNLKLNISNQVDLSPKSQTINKLFWRNKKSFLIYFLRFRSFDLYFSKCELESVLTTDENSPQQKVIQYAAIKNRVKVYAFQHGNIFDSHLAYMYGKYTVKPILPDCTFTWGMYFTTLLESEGGYLKSQLQTIGRINGESKVRKLNPQISTAKKIILYASQPQPDKGLRSQQMKDVLLLAKHFVDSYQLVIRPHPREVGSTYFNEIAKTVDFEDFIVDSHSDLQTQMELCELLIVSYSTVGSEFIPHYKPMLVLDYLKTDLIGWVKEGVGIPIENGQNLLQVFEKRQFEIDRKAYDIFINKYFYKMDNKAAVRAMKFIETS